jgi:NSS family neurotransmitter:Na+ symporter
VQDRTGLGRIPAVLGVGGAIALASVLLFPTSEGLYLLDAADHFINQYGIALAGLVVVIVVSWVLGKLPTLQQHADRRSAVSLRGWWRAALGVITPVVLGLMMWDSVRSELTENYEDYPTSFLLVAGWGVALGAIVLGVMLTFLPWKRDLTQQAERPAEPAERGGR